MKLISILAYSFFVITVSFVNAVENSDSLYQSEFSAFSKTYEKNYTTSGEKAKRYKIWRENFDYIVKHNAEADAGKHTFWLEMNDFGDMTTNEFSSTMLGYSMGLRQSFESNTDTSFLSSHVLSGKRLPKSVDLRTQGYVTGVRNQGSCGSCWAFAAIATIESAIFKTTKKLMVLSEQQLVDCSSAYGNMGCYGGWPLQALRYAIQAGGVCKASTYPYRGQKNRCSLDRSKIVAKIKTIKQIRSGDETALMDALTDNVVSIAIDASTRNFRFYKRGVFYDPMCSSKYLNHAVAAVGYGSLNGNDYYIVKNSWSAQWGENGYILMSRNRRNNCGILNEPMYAIV